MIGYIIKIRNIDNCFM